MPDRAQESGIRNQKPGLWWLWLSALVLVLDQASKRLVMASLTPYQEVIAVTPFFNLVHVHNTGAAFSLFADQPGWQRWFFLAVASIASGVILWLLAATRGRTLFAIGLALILGGALGNLIDRLAYGHVVDFLDFHAAGWHWPAFNLADSAITLGAGLLIWDGLWGSGAHRDRAHK
ncbi:MAG: signal peptidase II [Thiobacillaceae bacterium]